VGHLSVSENEQEQPRLVKARAELTAAVAMLREMGMTFWLPEAEAELAEAGR